MSKVRDCGSHKSGQDEEDIDFDFFSSPGRGEDNHKLSYQKKYHDNSSTGKPQVKSDMAATGISPVKSGSINSDTESDCPKSIKVVEARLPIASMDERHRNDNGKSKRKSKSYSGSDTSSYSESDSDQEYSHRHSKSDIKHKRPPSGKKTNDKHASGDIKDKDSYSNSNKSGHDSSTLERPKTSKGRLRDEKHSNEDKQSDYSDSFSDTDSYSTSSYTTSSCTDSETDSDMTHVSPLPSPHEEHTEKWEQLDTKEVEKEHLKLKLKQQLLKGDRDSVDLRLLMQAVLDLEREQEQKNKKTVFLVPPPGIRKKGQARNYSFSDDKSSDIDRENQRLMKQILKEARAAREAKQKTKLQRKQQSAMSKLTSSAVNRNRNLRKIEMENQVNSLLLLTLKLDLKSSACDLNCYSSVSTESTL